MTRQSQPLPAIDHANIVVLRGRLAGGVSTRERTSGVWSEATLQTSSALPTGTVREAVPIVWNGNADRFADAVDDVELVVAGRVRQRFFRSAGAVVSRTEVVAETVVAARRRAVVRRAIESIAESVLAVGSGRA